MRDFTQELWHEVAYDDLNGAVAAALTSAAVAMVKRTCTAVFADFPDHESYETILQTITQGASEKAQTQFGLNLYRNSAGKQQTEKVEERNLDAKEQFGMHAYHDLVAFITDFQMNRTGKPTKAMQAKLNSWKPDLDLQRATNEERITWRRLYTINWLYDLVNLFSSIVVQRNTMKGEHHVYEEVDWSTTGPWHQHRRLFGLNEFAGEITTLTMQKSSPDIRKKILPHVVFQLQCVVDSFAASRGWTLSPLRGHVVVAPPREFRPRRDVDLFLDRELHKDGVGLLHSIGILKQLLQKDANIHQDPNRHTAHSDLLDNLRVDFVNWLGESKYMHGLTTIPASRFSKQNANGLWEYSPLLCAAGLVEGLILIQRAIMHLWDKIPEPTIALHLHNMLVKKGYLKKEVGLYATLENLLQDSFFPDGIPTENFADTLVSHVATRQNDRSQRQRLATVQDQKTDTHHLLDPHYNRFFRQKSALMAHYDADWVPEKIPDSVLRIPSMLYMIRLSSTEREVDRATGERRLKQTELVHRAKVKGQTDAALLEAASIKLPNVNIDEEAAEAYVKNTIELKDYKTPPQRNPSHISQDASHISQHGKCEQPTGRALLDMIRVDMFADVCGNHAMSSLNYVWITCHLMLLFMSFEDRFRETRHPLWIQAYEQPEPQLKRQKRLALVVAAMKEEDDQALKLFAEQFENLRIGALGCIFWEELCEDELGVKGKPADECSVM